MAITLSPPFGFFFYVRIFSFKCFVAQEESNNMNYLPLEEKPFIFKAFGRRYSLTLLYERNVFFFLFLGPEDVFTVLFEYCRMSDSALECVLERFVSNRLASDPEDIRIRVVTSLVQV